MRYSRLPFFELISLTTTILFTLRSATATPLDTFENGLFEMKRDLGIPEELTSPSPESQNQPEFAHRRDLKVLGSWFNAEYLGEGPIVSSVGGLIPGPVDHLRTLLAQIKLFEEKIKDSRSELKRSEGLHLDDPIFERARYLTNALHLHEILEGMISTDFSKTPELKTTLLKKLNEIIVTALDGGVKLLIPISWKGNMPGGVLAELKKFNTDYQMVLFDAEYSFHSNENVNDKSLNSVFLKVPWKQYEISSSALKIAPVLIRGLLLARDKAYLDGYMVANTGGGMVAFIFEILLGTKEANRESHNIGLRFVFDTFLPGLVTNDLPVPDRRVLWKQIRSSIGPLATLETCFAHEAQSQNAYDMWKLLFGLNLVESFIKRYRNDIDILQNTRNRSTVALIIRRARSQLMQEMYGVLRIMKLVPEFYDDEDMGFWGQSSDHRSISVLADDRLEKLKVFLQVMDEEPGSLVAEKIRSSLIADGETRKSIHTEIEALELDINQLKYGGKWEKKLGKMSLGEDENKRILEKMRGSKFIKSHLNRQIKSKPLAVPKSVLFLIDRVLRQSKELSDWLKERRLNEQSLLQVNRGEGQRGIPLQQIDEANIMGMLPNPLDLSKYSSMFSKSADSASCALQIVKPIDTITEFIEKAKDLAARRFFWLRMGFDYVNPECAQYTRRNMESLLKAVDLDADDATLMNWAPKSFGQYSKFFEIANNFINYINNVKKSERTFEDMIVLVRLQSLIWRVIQAYDAALALRDPSRHLNLASYSLNYVQCRKFIKGDMSYYNHFLADSGAFSNVLYMESIQEMRTLCDALVAKASKGRTILNMDNYLTFGLFISAEAFDQISSADREIFIKMAQNPMIVRTAKNSFKQYNLGRDTFVENVAAAAMLGEVGSQVIYYHFFDAIKFLVGLDNTFNGRNMMLRQLPTFIPIKLPGGKSAKDDEKEVGARQVPMSFFPLFKINEKGDKNNLKPINEELLKKQSKSFISVKVTEMLKSQFLSLDLIVNHIAYGSSSFWTSSMSEPPASNYVNIGELMEQISDHFKQLVNSMNKDAKSTEIASSGFARKSVAGVADFLLNASAHVLRKIEIAPKYEELIMNLIMRSFQQENERLNVLLKKIEKDEVSLEEVAVKKHEPDWKYYDSDKDAANKFKSANENHLKKKASPDQMLKALINWSLLALRFSARVRTIKPEWANRYPNMARSLYSVMFQYTKINTARVKTLVPISKNVLSHVDYLLYMICISNLDDPNLRNVVYDSIKPEKHVLLFEKDNLVLPSMAILHRLVALNDYTFEFDAPLTEDFVNNQFGLDKVIKILRTLPKQNESFLKVMARFMSAHMDDEPQDILDKYPQAENLSKYTLNYGSFAINLLKGEILNGGRKLVDTNQVFKYSEFKTFFSQGNDAVVPQAGFPTEGCQDRFEVYNYMVPGSRYSICEDKVERKVHIYRAIPNFLKPCMLFNDAPVTKSVGTIFSIQKSGDVDMYICVRGNNQHFVWIRKEDDTPDYITHGRIWYISKFNEVYHQISLVKHKTTADEYDEKSFEMDEHPKDPPMESRFGYPLITMPKLQIREIPGYSDVALLPLNAETKLAVVPEAILRFGAGSGFGAYKLKNQMVFLFNRFRFRDRPQVPLTLMENEEGNLMMLRRSDLEVCQDQLFEEDFRPALMMRRVDDDKTSETRYAYVPLTNPKPPLVKQPVASVGYVDDEVDVDGSSNKPPPSEDALDMEDFVFMEAINVEKVEGSNANGLPHRYRLKPTSRLQRIVLAFHNMRMKNFANALNFLDPRSEFDHNTKFSRNEARLLRWIVYSTDSEDPEAIAIRLHAKLHLLLNRELFPMPPKRDQNSNSNAASSDINAAMNIKTDKQLAQMYQDKRNSGNTFKKSLLESSSQLGAYFNIQTVLPRKYLITTTFRDFLSSELIRDSLVREIARGIVTPGKDQPSIALFCFVLRGSFDPFGNRCNVRFEIEYRDFNYRADHGVFFDELTVAEESQVQNAISKRFENNFLAVNSKEVSLVARKLILLHGNEKEIPKELQEYCQIFVRLKYQTADDYDVAYDVARTIRALGDPKFYEANHDQIKASLNFKQFKDDLTPKKRYPDSDFLSTESRKVTEALEFCRAPEDKQLFIKPQPDPLHLDTYGASYKDQIYEKLLQNTLNRGTLNENSMKLSTEDFAYVSDKNRIVFIDLINYLNKQRLSTKGLTESLSVKMAKDSKTLNALRQAISDYLAKVKGVIPYEDLDSENMFKPLKEVIHDFCQPRLNDLEPWCKGKTSVMRSLEEKFDRMFVQMRDSKDINSIRIITKLRRVFNFEKAPTIDSLQECFMQMSMECLTRKLPEMSHNSLIVIVKLVKQYFLSSILKETYGFILNEKIKKFENHADLINKAEARLKTAEGPVEIAALKQEITDNKDTALLYVEDVYLEMEKLLFFEARLRDPVTLSFEFMSHKFRLTKAQVEDVKSLSTRRWEMQLQETVAECFERINQGFDNDLSKWPQKVGSSGPDDTESTLASVITMKCGDLIRDENKYDVIRYVSELYKLMKRQKSVKSDKQDYSLTEENMWAYMTKLERSSPRNEAIKQRPAMYSPLLEVGTLDPIDGRDLYVSKVIQRKMAAGKTMILGTASTVKKADGRTLSVLVLLSALYQSSAPDMQERTTKFFGSRGFAFVMPNPRLTIPEPKSDSTNPARKFLNWTLKTLLTTIKTRGYLVVTPETLQSFLNSYVEFLDAFVRNPLGRVNSELSACLHLFATIYDLFRTRGSLILDEIDSSMRPQKELNFPTTERERIKIEAVELTADLLFHSAFDETVKNMGLRLLDNQQAAMTKEQLGKVTTAWRRYVHDELERKESGWYRAFFGVNVDVASSFYNSERIVKFLFEDLDLEKLGVKTEHDVNNNPDIALQSAWLAEINRSLPDVFQILMIMKMQFKRWLPECLKYSVNEHYGPSLAKGKQEIKFAIPYTAANTPAEGSVFADRWETVNKTFMMYLVKRLESDEISQILKDLKTLNQDTSTKINLQALFDGACNENLLSIRFDNQGRVIDKDGSLMACMNDKSQEALQLIFVWVVKRVFEPHDFYAEQITSNAINLTTMFPSVQGYSGTIDNVNILPIDVMIDAERDHRINEEANGAITDKLLNQDDCVTVVKNMADIKSLNKLLDAMCVDFAGNLGIFSAFIDVGALFKDFKNEEVALGLARKFKRKIVLYYEEKTNQLNYIEYDHVTGDYQKAGLEGTETGKIDRTTSSTVQDRFTYYDQRHITGSDILQPPTAKAFLTIGPKVLLRDILQGVMRMRQFQTGQSIHFVTNSAVIELLGELCADLKAADSATAFSQSHLIALGAYNEDEKQLSENMRLYRAKIDAEIRAYVLDNLTDALASADPYYERVRDSWKMAVNLKFGVAHIQLYEATRSLFIRDVHENVLNWATVDVEIDTVELVERYKESRFNMIPKPWRDDEIGRGIEKLAENLRVLTEEIPKDLEENDLSYSRSLLNYLNKKGRFSYLPKALGILEGDGHDIGATVELELQMELQTELELQLDQIVLGSGEKPNDEPTLKIEFPDGHKIETKFEGTPKVETRNSPWRLIGETAGLLTPWKIYQEYMLTGRSNDQTQLQQLYELDLLCPGMFLPDGPNDFATTLDYCRNCRGIVGVSYGMVEISQDKTFDFSTMMAREATHLLFWRGKTQSTSTDYRYAIFLLTSSEATTLYEQWKFKSSMFSIFDEFWLTDLLGYEIHGHPFAETVPYSRAFSLLDKLYQEHFLDLHMRALFLNGTFNLLLAGKDLSARFFAFMGDKTSMKDSDVMDGVDVVALGSKRAKYLMTRMTLLSKMTVEIVPSDPFVMALAMGTQNKPVDWPGIRKDHKAHIARGNFATLESESVKLLEKRGENRWNPAKNIATDVFFTETMKKGLLTTLLILLGLAVLLLWATNNNIEWLVTIKSGWQRAQAFFAKTPVRPEEESKEAETEVDTEAETGTVEGAEESPLKLSDEETTEKT